MSRERLTDSADKLKYHANLYRLREGHEMKPWQLINSTAHMLYQKRFQPFYVSPIVAGIDDDGKAYVCGYDSIGSPEISNISVSGTASDELMGMCDSIYRENMEPDELVEVIGQCLLAAENRDAFSGWGIEIYLLTKDNLTIYNAKPRQD